MKQPTPIATLITEINTQLHTSFSDSTLCEQYSWWMLEAITGKNKTQLLADTHITLTAHQQEKLTSWLHKMVHEHVPIQYLLGSVPFNNCEILVEPPILIPRPETEEWCFNLIEQLKKSSIKNLTILDLCSGTGCIAIALAKAFPHAQIYAVDINPHAVALGKKNALHNRCKNITFIESDLFTHIPEHMRFDLIVGNPPYIDPATQKTMDSSVTKWEDPRALFADNQGLAIIAQIIEQAPDWLTRNNTLAQARIPQLMLEIDATQKNATTALMHKNGYSEVVVYKDLEGKDRVISGSINHVAIPPFIP